MTFFCNIFKKPPNLPKYYEMDLISSKGLKKKNKYSLSPTGFAHDEKTLIEHIKSAEQNLYIKFGPDLEKLPSLLKYIKKPVTLVTTDGDGSIPLQIGHKKALEILEHPMIQRWFTQNYDGSLEHSKLFPYPIGPDLHSPQWMIGGHPINKVNYMLSLRKKYPQKKNKILCDTYITRHRHQDRLDFCQKMKKSKHVTMLHLHRGIKSIFKLYAKHRFIVSPHGGGLDCHRTWEALLLGSIPVVKTSSLDALYKDLPVVVVNDWNECKDPENLKRWWEKLKEKTDSEYIQTKLGYSSILNY